ncbi:RNA-binding S4 domain-containing protein [Allofustis seminis]|uniref:RNA-binding S4 domain-containing protein n=1 Tax=Allofustis seminis TaxID=166939 RepID=UPI00037805A6|nr:RNA-binding S4 domain-containing protein [Allofustis seminis]
MRVDKFLKISRIVKRRPVAKAMGDAGRIEINNQIAKASTPVEVGDYVTIYFGNKIMTVQVADLRQTTKKMEAAELYRIISEKSVENN